jgi:hypothetical protein
MSQDPFYEQILSGLKGDLNPQHFEDCMADLLRELFPTLVPVRGGKDSGMDGAIADGEGEPFPLVVTTGENVERNLRESLESYVERGQPSRKVVFATSKALTPQRRLKLMDLARERGFTLVQVIDQRGVANLLCKSPRWYKQLLSLSGQPSALSVIPRSRRPLLDLEPIGRVADLEWLQQTTGDRVLSGEPGSGKTFLLYYLARQRWGLFLVDPDGDVAGALREQRPAIVIVDDAHAEPRVLEKLRHLRQQTGMNFSIVATTWEGARNEVVEAMGGIPEDKVRKLELLTRAEILEVFRSTGIEEDAGNMRQLIDQAANKPGLAVTIATLWLAGAWREVVEGKILSRTLLAFFQEFVCPESTDVLAAFSLGGDQGMGMEAVRDLLGLSRLNLRHVAAGLAAGGVLSEVNKDTLAVWPRPLRSSLIRTVFFPSPGQPRHPYQEIIQKAPNFGKAVETLIAAKSVGAEVPAEELRHLVAGSGSVRAWNGLAQLSEQDARWVLANYSGDLLDVGKSILWMSPEIGVRPLLKRAESVTGSVHSQTKHPMRILSGWVRDLNLPLDQAIERRKILAKSSKKYILEEGDLSIGIHGICLALSPSLESHNLDPGAGRIVTITSGLLLIDELRALEAVWRESHDVVTKVDALSWEHLSSMLWDWVYPEYSARSVEIPEGVREVMHSFAARVLADLAPLAQGSPGLAAGLQSLAKEVGLELSISQDLDFEKLYPTEGDEDLGDWKRRENAQFAGVKELVEKWLTGSPHETARKIARYEKEAKQIYRIWPRLTPVLCRELAARVREPEQWLDAFIENDAPYDLVEPFLRASLDRLPYDGEEIQDRLLRSHQYAWLAVESILQASEPPLSLLRQVLDKVSSFPRFVETLCVRGQVSLSNLRLLLGHSNWEVALTAALGEWLSNPKGEVRPEVMEAWRAAILQANPDEHSGSRYWLGEIFKADRDLALNWLTTRLGEDLADRAFLAPRGAYSTAISVLSQEQRIKILNGLGRQKIPQPLVSLLVDKDPAIFRKLLESKDLARFHREPLAGIPDEKWAELASIALEWGYDARWIAEAAFYSAGISTFWGPESQHWNQWDQGFAQLEDGQREVQEIAHYGRQIAQARVQKARKEERREEVHGI